MGYGPELQGLETEAGGSEKGQGRGRCPACITEGGGGKAMAAETGEGDGGRWQRERAGQRQRPCMIAPTNP